MVPQGCRISQNNVAREAGLDASTLKKSRYPELIAEIRAFIEQQRPISASTRERRSDKQKAAAYKMQRDALARALIESDQQILALSQRLARYESPTGLIRLAGEG